MPGAGRNPWPACKNASTRQSPQVQPVIRHSLRDGLTVYTALSLVTGLVNEPPRFIASSAIEVFEISA